MTVRQHRLSNPSYPSDYIYPADKDYPLNEDWEGGPIALLDTSEGLNNQAWHLTYLADAPPAPYNPDMMQYDGSTGYYVNSSVNTTGAGNKVTAVLRFKIPSFTGGSFSYMLYHIPLFGRMEIVAWSSDYADSDKADTISVIVRNSANTIIGFLFSPVGYLDDGNHTLFATFDGDVGTAEFIIDGTDVDDTGNADRVAPTTGTLSTAASGQASVGATPSGTSKTAGDIGYVGISDVGGLAWQDFMEADGSPKQLDETTWTEWGGQPAFWRDTGDMELSLGTEGAMTKNGTITQVPADPIPGIFQGFTVTPEDTGDPVSVLSGVNSVQCGLAFDQNGHVTIVWVDQFNAGHLYWYDTVAGDWIITDFENPVGGVGLTLDDKRNEQTGASDILLWYTLLVDGHYEIYTREQRDRFATPYPMEPGLVVWPYFKKLGMNDELRVQPTMTNVGPS